MRRTLRITTAMRRRGRWWAGGLLVAVACGVAGCPGLFKEPGDHVKEPPLPPNERIVGFFEVVRDDFDQKLRTFRVRD